MKLIVGIPAKNEEKTIASVIKSVRKYTHWVYVFDDGSTDNTFRISKKSGANVISNPCNLGKGATLRYAIRWFISSDVFKINDKLLFIDADGQHNADLIPLFVNKAKETNANLIVGKRILIDYPIYKRIGNIFLNLLSSILSGIKIEDSESGFRLYDYELAIDILKFSSSKKYGIEMESNIICGRTNGKLTYIPVASKYAGEKGTTLKDGIINALIGIICFVKVKNK